MKRASAEISIRFDSIRENSRPTPVRLGEILLFEKHRERRGSSESVGVARDVIFWREMDVFFGLGGTITDVAAVNWTNLSQMVHLSLSYQGVTTTIFPRSNERGLIEASCSDLIRRRRFSFPRSNERGLIEADLWVCFTPCVPLLSAFKRTRPH